MSIDLQINLINLMKIVILLVEEIYNMGVLGYYLTN